MRPERYDQVMAAFLAASQLNEDQRGAFLMAIKEDDELVREVESLLRHHDSHTISTKRDVADDRDTRKDRAGSRITTTPFIGKLPESTQHPILAAAILIMAISVVGFWLNQHIRAILRTNLADHLHTVLVANVSALREWINEKKAEVDSWASHDELRTRVVELVDFYQNEQPGVEALRNFAIHDELLRELRPVYQRAGSYGIAVINRDGVNLASSRASLVGLPITPTASTSLQRVLQGQTVFVHPARSRLHVVGFPASLEQSVMAVAAPIRDTNGKVVAALAFAFDGRREFADLLTSANLGSSAETFVVDATGLLLSNLKQVARLYETGLVPLGKSPAMRLELRDPGRDLTRSNGGRQRDPMRPLTAMAASVAAGRAGLDLDGYRNVLGQIVVGAWMWLPDYNFAVAAEILKSEAYAPLQLVKNAFLVLLGMIVLLTLAIILASGSLSNAHRQLKRSRQLGQYELQSLVGQGGMGKVYLARHALLKRPTAVKLFDGRMADRDSVRRFEREVQLTSRLEHPNTIRIYDFGQTSDDLFYYAMEYLDGLNLAQLVAVQGRLPVPRVIFLLIQACGSLKEAHETGMIHRDIKPGNIMVCHRGGLFDVVKVLDFGLAKELTDDEVANVEHSQRISGTPRYIAPERIAAPRQVDARSDLYSLGAVAYFLLAGKEIYADQSGVQLLVPPVQFAVPRVAEMSDIEVPSALDDLIHACLAPLPDDRPRGVEEILKVLIELERQYPWSQQEAATAWSKRSG